MDPCLESDSVPWWMSKRLRLCMILMFGTMIVGIHRCSFSMAIVCMVNHTASTPRADSRHSRASIHDGYNSTNGSYGNLIGGASNDSFSCFDGDDNYEVDNSISHRGQYVWSKQTQAFILGSYYVGYGLAQIPFGWLSERFGAKRVYCGSFYPLSLVVFLIPVCAQASPWLLIVLRAAIGVCHAPTFMGVHVIFSHWSTPWERSRLIGWAILGTEIGNVIAFPISSLLCEHGGWQYVFYLGGALTFAWCVLFTFCGYDSPDLDPFVSSVERNYLKIIDSSPKRVKLVTPWSSIFTSKAFWALIVAHFGVNWGQTTFTCLLPTYFNDITRLTVIMNSVVSMLSFMLLSLLGCLSAAIADCLIKAKSLTVANTRKLMTVLCLMVPACLLVVVGFLDCTQWIIAVCLLTLTLGMYGVHYSGVVVNYSDIAHNYSGILFGISNTIGQTTGFLTLYINGAITSNNTQEEWRTVFYISAAIHTFCCVVYLVFAKGTTRSWARPPSLSIQISATHPECNSEKQSLKRSVDND